MAAKGFNLVARLNFQGPYNLDKVIGRAQRMVQGGIKGKVDLTFNKASERQLATLQKSLREVNKELKVVATNAAKASEAISKMATSLSGMNRSTNATVKEVNNLNSATKSTSKATEKMNSEMAEFGRVAGLAVRRFAGFTIGTGVIFGLGRAFTTATADAVAFERELIKVAQVTGGTTASLSGLTDEITRLSSGLGVSSADLLEVSRTLAQAGLSASQTKTALEALAKSSLAPTFNNIQNTTEGAIAAIRQFKFGAESLESVLGSVNAVAGQFAVEAEDIISAVRRTGGVFAAASGNIASLDESVKLQRFREFIALFTSVRATTRESAETIATGLRTVFTRIQRGSTIQQLQNLGINLQDTEGQFLGVFDAVEQLSIGLKNLPTTSTRFNQIIEELGGFRQVGKVIPLIKEFNTAQDALKVAQGGVNSITEDATLAQQSLAVQITRVREEFAALIRDLTNTDSFRSILKLILSTTSGLIKLADSVKPILPILTAFAAIKGTQAVLGFGKGFSKGLRNVSNIDTAGIGSSTAALAAATGNSSAGVTRNTAAIDKNTQAILSLTTAIKSAALSRRGFATGGIVPGSGNRDTYPANLMPGEFVIRKRVVEQVGADNLQALNQGRTKFATGGKAVLGPFKKGLNPDAKNTFGAVFLKSVEDLGETSAGIPISTIVKKHKQAETAADLGYKASDKIPVNLISSGIGGQLVEDFEGSVSNRFKELIKDASGFMSKRLSASVKTDPESLSLKRFDVASLIGNVFEASLVSLADPYDIGTDSKQNLDFPKGLGSLSSNFNPALTSLPSDAKRTPTKDAGNSLLDKFATYIAGKLPVAPTKRKSDVKPINLNNREARLFQRNVENARKKNEQPADIIWKILKREGYIKSISKDVPTNVEGKIALIEKANRDLNLGFATGGRNPSSTDTVPALLTPGEFVFNRDAAQQIGYQNLEKLNKGNVQGFANGGLVGGRLAMSDGSVVPRVNYKADYTNIPSFENVTGKGRNPIADFIKLGEEAALVMDKIADAGKEVGSNFQEITAAQRAAAKKGLRAAARGEVVNESFFNNISKEGISRLSLPAENNPKARGLSEAEIAKTSASYIKSASAADGYAAIQNRISNLMKSGITAKEAQIQAEREYGITLKAAKKKIGQSRIDQALFSPIFGTSARESGGKRSFGKTIRKGLGGFGGFALAGAAPAIVSSILGSNASPTAQGIGGAFSGGIAGGITGFQTAGPIGAAIGALGGAVTTALSSFKEANLEQATSKLSSAIESSADAFENFNKTGDLEKLNDALSLQLTAALDVQKARIENLDLSTVGIAGRISDFRYGVTADDQTKALRDSQGIFGILGSAITGTAANITSGQGGVGTYFDLLTLGANRAFGQIGSTFDEQSSSLAEKDQKLATERGRELLFNNQQLVSQFGQIIKQRASTGTLGAENSRLFFNNLRADKDNPLNESAKKFQEFILGLTASQQKVVYTQLDAQKAAGDLAATMRETSTAASKAINLFVLQLDYASASIADAANSMQDIQEVISGRAANIDNPGRVQNAKEIRDVFANPLGKTDNELRTAFDNLTSSAGISKSNFAIDTSNAIGGLRQLQDVLPTILSNAISVADKADKEDATSIILSEVEKQKAFTDLPGQIQNILFNKLKATLTNREADLGSGPITDILANSGLVDELTGGVRDEVLKAASGVVKTFNELNKSYEAGLQTIIDTNIKIADLQNNVFAVRSRNRSIIAKSQGRNETLGERLFETRRAIDFQAKRAGSESSSVSDLRSQFFSLIEERDNLQARREGLITSGSNIKTGISELQGPIIKNSEQLVAVQKALQLTVDSVNSLTEIQNELTSLERQKEGATNLVEKLATAGPEERQQINKQVEAALQFVSGAKLDPATLRDALSGLDLIKPLFNEQGQRNIQENQNKLLLEGLPPQFKGLLQQLVQGASINDRILGIDEETVNLRKQIIDISRSQIVAAQTLADAARIQAPQQELLLRGLDDFVTKFGIAVDNFNKVGKKVSTGGIGTAFGGGAAATFASGGRVGGSYKGKDTIPAMLMPGEFVVSRDAAKNNIGLLSAINSGKKAKYMAKGGLIDEGEIAIRKKEILREILMASGLTEEQARLAEIVRERGGVPNALLKQRTAPTKTSELAQRVARKGNTPDALLHGLKVKFGQQVNRDDLRARAGGNSDALLGPSKHSRPFINDVPSIDKRVAGGLDQQRKDSIEALKGTRRGRIYEVSPARQARKDAYDADRLRKQNEFRAKRGLDPVTTLATTALTNRGEFTNNGFGFPGFGGNPAKPAGGPPVAQSKPASGNPASGNPADIFSAASKELIPSLNSFNTAVNNLVRVTEQLQNISIPESISIDFGKPLQVNLSINGADALANMEPALQEMITSQLNVQLRKFINPLTGETKGGSDIG